MVKRCIQKKVLSLAVKKTSLLYLNTFYTNFTTN